MDFLTKKYKIYSLSVEGYREQYIGVTIDPKRRLKHHKLNIKNREEKVYTFYSEHNITKHDIRMNILNSFDTKEEAFAYERKTILICDSFLVSLNTTHIDTRSELHGKKISEANIGKKTSKNTSGFVGVSSAGECWQVHYCGKYLGVFKDIKDAVQARENYIVKINKG